jgi:hypothetical protein
MHDAIALANLIYAVPTTNSVDLTKIFEEYQKERIPAVMASYNHSQLMSKIMDRGIEGAVILWLYTHIPFWLWKLVVCLPFFFVSFLALFFMLLLLLLLWSLPCVIETNHHRHWTSIYAMKEPSEPENWEETNAPTTFILFF